ncbi:hypothetical protein [Psittacicella gerlachiana]|uniref:Uncharacterized protein n=1 Tax=Psittacicella gerlachiana TaxID=2028574 RepID=A0A3A1Y2Z7_9GAMM|nr:hypothetical protein [Psittacicella gerlachiana]RIY32603.1 hypothetical protein CKF59_06860 [Psittacicella gerlachiana]
MAKKKTNKSTVTEDPKSKFSAKPVKVKEKKLQSTAKQGLKKSGQVNKSFSSLDSFFLDDSSDFEDIDVRTFLQEFGIEELGDNLLLDGDRLILLDDDPLDDSNQLELESEFFNLDFLDGKQQSSKSQNKVKPQEQDKPSFLELAEKDSDLFADDNFGAFTQEFVENLTSKELIGVTKRLEDNLGDLVSRKAKKVKKDQLLDTTKQSIIQVLDARVSKAENKRISEVVAELEKEPQNLDLYKRLVSEQFNSPLNDFLYTIDYPHQAYELTSALFGVDESFVSIDKYFKYNLDKYEDNLHYLEDKNELYHQVVAQDSLGLARDEPVPVAFCSKMAHGKVDGGSAVSRLFYSQEQLEQNWHHKAIDRLHFIKRLRSFTNVDLRATIFEDYEKDFAKLWQARDYASNEYLEVERPLIKVPTGFEFYSYDQELANLLLDSNLVSSDLKEHIFTEKNMIHIGLNEIIMEEYDYVPRYDYVKYDVIETTDNVGKLYLKRNNEL